MIEFNQIWDDTHLSADGWIDIPVSFTGNLLSVNLGISPNLDRLNTNLGVLVQQYADHSCLYDIKSAKSAIRLILPETDKLRFFPNKIFDTYSLVIEYAQVNFGNDSGGISTIPNEILALPDRVSAIEIKNQEQDLDVVSLTGRVATLESVPVLNWGTLTGKPSTFTPSAHSHAISEITGLSTSLDAKADDSDVATLTSRVTTLEGNSASSLAVKSVTIESFAQNAIQVLSDITYGILGIYEYTTFTNIQNPTNLTANTSDPSFTVNQSSANSAPYNGFRLFDGNPTSEPDWCTNATVPQWVSVDFGTAKQITKYSMLPSSVSITNFNAPRNWQLQGSSNGTTWVDINTQTNITGWVSNTAKTFTLSSPESYRYYRLLVTVTQGGSLVRLGELRLMDSDSFAYVKADSNYSVQYPTSGFVHSIKRVASGTAKTVIKYI